MIRVGLKYCGGCDPAYERVEYVQEIQDAAGDRIEWVSLDAEDYSIIMIISGCERECILTEITEKAGGRRVLNIRDNRRSPQEILSLITEET